MHYTSMYFALKGFSTNNHPSQQLLTQKRTGTRLGSNAYCSDSVVGGGVGPRRMPQGAGSSIGAVNAAAGTGQKM